MTIPQTTNAGDAPSLEDDGDKLLGLPPEQIRLPWNVVRLLLSDDGRPPHNPALRPVVARNALQIWKGRRKWDGATEFERYESAEIAFGYILRANPKKRPGGERRWGTGFVDRGDHVAIQAGWRVHKQVKVVSDYFDGTFKAKLRFQVQDTDGRQRLLILVLDVQVTWNSNPVADLFDGGIERFMAQKVQAELQKQIDEKVIRSLTAMVESTEELQRLRGRTEIGVQGVDIVLTINVEPNNISVLDFTDNDPRVIDK